jgi:hypothetical protein
MVYCALTPQAAFAESIAPYRPKTGLVEDIMANTEKPDDESDPALESGFLPANYLGSRRLGLAELSPGTLLVQLNHSDVHKYLSTRLAEDLARVGLQKHDAKTVLSPDRRLTRPISRVLYELRSQETYRDVVGIAYTSPLQASFECIALWAPIPVEGIPVVDPITEAHPNLCEAAAIFGIRLPR